jgi:DNA-binding transcriptional LysR family regulator
MIPALRKAGLAYSIVFNSPDYHAKIAALQSGIGLAALPARMIPASLVQAKEYYLPSASSSQSVALRSTGYNSQSGTTFETPV